MRLTEVVTIEVSSLSQNYPLNMLDHLKRITRRHVQPKYNYVIVL